MHDVEHKGQKETVPTLLELVLQLHGDFRRQLEPSRVTPLQAGVLLFLRRHAEARVTDAATALCLRLPTMSVLVKALVRKRWVITRRSVEDRRAVCVRLSRQGEVLARTIAHRVRHVEATVTEQDRRTLGMIPKGGRAQTLARCVDRSYYNGPPCEALMPFSIRPYRRFPVHCAVTYNAGPFLRLPLAYFFGFASLITLLAMNIEPAYAEWVNIGANDQAGLTVYVDLDTVRRKGDLVKMWMMHDFKTIQTVAGSSRLSSKGQMQFDCAEERSRLLAVTHFSGNMGSGNVVFSNSDEQKWEPVAPVSIDQILWKIACGKQ